MNITSDTKRDSEFFILKLDVDGVNVRDYIVEVFPVESESESKRYLIETMDEKVILENVSDSYFVSVQVFNQNENCYERYTKLINLPKPKSELGRVFSFFDCLTKTNV